MSDCDWFDIWDVILSDMCREERDEWLHDEEERAADERMEHEYGKPRDKETP